jgi:hypothetical protein
MLRCVRDERACVFGCVVMMLFCVSFRYCFCFASAQLLCYYCDLLLCYCFVILIPMNNGDGYLFVLLLLSRVCCSKLFDIDGCCRMAMDASVTVCYSLCTTSFFSSTTMTTATMTQQLLLDRC